MHNKGRRRERDAEKAVRRPHADADARTGLFLCSRGGREGGCQGGNGQRHFLLHVAVRCGRGQCSLAPLSLGRRRCCCVSCDAERRSPAFACDYDTAPTIFLTRERSTSLGQTRIRSYPSSRLIIRGSFSSCTIAKVAARFLLAIFRQQQTLARPKGWKAVNSRSGVVPILNPSAYAPNSIFADTRENTPKPISMFCH